MRKNKKLMLFVISLLAIVSCTEGIKDIRDKIIGKNPTTPVAPIAPNNPGGSNGNGGGNAGNTNPSNQLPL